MPDRKDVRQVLDQTIEACVRQSANCAQSAFIALQTAYGLEGKDIVSALEFYPCGTTTSDGTCGAVAGAILALGLARSTSGTASLQRRYEGLVRIQHFCKAVSRQLGGISCREILKADLKHWNDTLDSFPRWRQHHLERLTNCTAIIKACVAAAADVMDA